MQDMMWALVVEGDAHSLVAIASILHELNVRFIRNTTGANVLEQLRQMQPHPDVVLIDLDLPHADAFATARAISTDADFRHIPLIALGDHAPQDVQARVRRSGFSAYVAKPLPRRSFGALLKRAAAGDNLWEVAARL